MNLKIKYLENFKKEIEEAIKSKIESGMSEETARNEAEAYKPFYATDGSSCFDVRSLEDFILEPGQRKLFKLGIAVAVEPGYELQLRPRSGLALKEGLSMVNCIGTIDSDYRGEVGAILINLGQNPIHISKWDRIAQAGIYPVIKAELVEVYDLDETERGSGGYGHSGKR